MWRRGEEEGFETVHQLAEAQTDLATVRDAMEATDEALARKEQEAAYMAAIWSTVKCECGWGGSGGHVCVCDCPFLRGVCAGAVGVRTVSYPKSEKTHWRFLNGTVS